MLHPRQAYWFFFQLHDYQQATIPDVFTVVWPCQYNFKQSSVFTLQWKLDFLDQNNQIQALEVISCESIVRHACMIPENLDRGHNSLVFHEIWPKELWAMEF